MRILIIEDEVLVAKDLQNLIAKLAPDAAIIQTLTSVESAKAWFNENKMPDLILSDIQLSDGISFDIFESLHCRIYDFFCVPFKLALNVFNFV